MITDGNATEIIARLRSQSVEALSAESLTLEEIFVSTLQPQGVWA